MRTWFSLLSLAVFFAPACSEDSDGSKRERCEAEGETRDCTCDDAQRGHQECSADQAWSVCDCGAEPAEADAAAGEDAGHSDPLDAAPSTDSGEKSEDAAADPDGSTADSGSDSDSGAPVPPYASCAKDNDCNPGDVCRKFAAMGACAAPCQDDTDCAVPDGTYEAEVVCGDDGHCRIDCSPAGVPPMARSCPNDMMCLGMASNRSCLPSES